jgi:hypothetical protein
MSWLFSRALVEEYLGENFSDGEPSAPSSGNHTPQAYLPPDRMTAFSRPSRFGMTFKPLTESLGAELLTLYLAAFHARTSQQPEKAQALTESAAECGNTWRGWLAKYDLDTSSWRTAQCSLLEDSIECLQTLPRWGMTRDGLLWELPTLERRISGTGSGLWRTPTVGMLNADRAKDPEYTARKEAKGQTITLADQVKHARLWPTPTVCGNYNRNGASPTSGDGLATAVLKCATPTARDWRSGKASQATLERNSRPLSEQIGGSLNPMWVEWLMGWPLGWTDLKPLEMDKFHCALQQHGEF